MPSVIDTGLSEFGHNDESKLKKRKLERSETMIESRISSSPKVWISKKCKSPRICISSRPNSDANRKFSDCFSQKSKWNPIDPEQMSIVKEALHISTLPSSMVCREKEHKRVFDFCKVCIEHERAGSLYICGCPGTGKTLSMEKLKQLLIEWVKEAGFELPDVLTMNCTSLTSTREIFCKILERYQPRKKTNGASSPLQDLQNLFSKKQQSSNKKMMLIIVDELDYLITRDRAVLHDLFMLTTFAYSRCILIGIANAIDLADRFLPKLQSLNCKPVVVTFRAYSKDQILRILQQRLMALPYDDVFQPQALELCARKVAAASGDMRKALSVCRGAIEVLEAELRDTSSHTNSLLAENASPSLPPLIEFMTKQEVSIVKVDHMAIALSRTFKSGIVDIIQSLPQHQQVILCSAVKLFRRGKKDTTVGEMNKSYSDFCNSALIPPAGSLEFSNMCKVLSDQGLLKLGQSREDKLKRVTLKVDEADITFALQGIFVGTGNSILSELSSIIQNADELIISKAMLGVGDITFTEICSLSTKKKVRVKDLDNFHFREDADESHWLVDKKGVGGIFFTETCLLSTKKKVQVRDLHNFHFREDADKSHWLVAKKGFSSLPYKMFSPTRAAPHMSIQPIKCGAITILLHLRSRKSNKL